MPITTAKYAALSVGGWYAGASIFLLCRALGAPPSLLAFAPMAASVFLPAFGAGSLAVDCARRPGFGAASVTLTWIAAVAVACGAGLPLLPFAPLFLASTLVALVVFTCVYIAARIEGKRARLAAGTR